jgi:hypothetical protein
MLIRKAESCNLAEFPLLYTAMAASWPVLGPFSLLGSYSKALHPLHVPHIIVAGPSMQCCGSGSGIRGLFDPWTQIWDPELVFSGSQIPDPKPIFLSLTTNFWVKSSIIL